MCACGFKNENKTKQKQERMFSSVEKSLENLDLNGWHLYRYLGFQRIFFFLSILTVSTVILYEVY